MISPVVDKMEMKNDEHTDLNEMILKLSDWVYDDRE